MFYILDTSSLTLTVRPAIGAESKIDNDDSRFVVFIWLLFKFCLNIINSLHLYRLECIEAVEVLIIDQESIQNKCIACDGIETDMGPIYSSMTDSVGPKIDNDDSRFVVFIWFHFKFCLNFINYLYIYTDWSVLKLLKF